MRIMRVRRVYLRTTATTTQRRRRGPSAYGPPPSPTLRTTMENRSNKFLICLQSVRCTSYHITTRSQVAIALLCYACCNTACMLNSSLFSSSFFFFFSMFFLFYLFLPFHFIFNLNVDNSPTICLSFFISSWFIFLISIPFLIFFFISLWIFIFCT